MSSTLIIQVLCVPKHHRVSVYSSRDFKVCEVCVCSLGTCAHSWTLELKTCITADEEKQMYPEAQGILCTCDLTVLFSI